ncbi:hypothetical protein BLD48_05680 [Exiguobacterium sp. KRL4]|nr:hypothetical protein BLD48_05680 [Exiguobacterium sp. KRL4]
MDTQILERLVRMETKIDVFTDVRQTADNAWSLSNKLNGRVDTAERDIKELKADTRGSFERIWGLCSPVLTGLTVYFLTH